MEPARWIWVSSIPPPLGHASGIESGHAAELALRHAPESLHTGLVGGGAAIQAAGSVHVGADLGGEAGRIAEAREVSSDLFHA